VKIVRPFNCYGPRQSLRAIVPTLIAQMIAGEDVALGNLRPTRDLTYVTDTVAGFLAIARADGLAGAPVNVGMNHEISIGDLAVLIARLMGVSPRIIPATERARPEASEVERLVCDNSLLLKSTDWRPAHTLESGLRETIEWFKHQGAVARAPSTISDRHSHMKAVILAGGLGSRLQPFTQVIPKPLLPIGESSVLEIQILSLARLGFDDIFIATNYMSEYIEAFLATARNTASA